MPLVSAILQDGFLRQFRAARVSGGALTAQAFAQTYFSYAVAAGCAYGPFVPTGTEQPRLAAALGGAFASPGGSAALVGAAWGAGLSLFWAGALFGLGAATGLPGVPPMIGQVIAALSNPQNTAEAAAVALATALDVGTRTLVIGGPSGPVPVV